MLVQMLPRQTKRTETGFGLEDDVSSAVEAMLWSSRESQVYLLIVCVYVKRYGMLL